MRVRDALPLLGLAGLGATALLGLSHRGEAVDPTRLERELAPLELELPDREAAAHLAGRVVDGEGRALAGALVAAESGPRLAFARSDGAGAFRVEGLGEGPLEVLVLARGFEPARRSLPGPARDLRLVPGPAFADPPVLEPHLAAPFQALVEVPPGLRGGQGPPLELWLEPLEPARADSRALCVPRRAAVGQDGSVVLADLAPGRYRPHLLPGWARGGTWPDLLDPTLADGAEFAHPAAEPPLLRPVSGGLRLRATVDGRPAEGALAALSQWTADGPRPWPTRFAASDGRVEVPHLPAGRYRLELRSGSRSAVREFELARGEQLAIDPVELTDRGPDGER